MKKLLLSMIQSYLKLRKNKKGFSLMELLVVVSILGALTVIAIPAYNTYRGTADDAAAKASATSIYRAFQACLANGGTYATTSCGSTTVNGTLESTCGSGSTAEAPQSGTAKSGQCFVASDATDDFCVSSNSNGSLHCVDNSGSSGKDKFCTSGTAICTVCTGTPATCDP